MSSNYPNSIDTFINPVGTDSLSSPDHAVLHTHVNDSITNVQLELGTNARGTDVSVRTRLDRLDATTMLAANNLSEVTNAASARSHIGLGTMSTQNSGSVAITGGTISGATITGISVAGLSAPVAVVDGGTGATTASGARTSLGLGSVSIQNASAIALTGGTITGTTITGINISGLNSALAIADGGTGATSASAARTALGLGTIALQAASNVAITGGSITGVGLTNLTAPLALASGGTGSTTAAGARTALGLGTIATQAASAVNITGGSALNLSTFSAGTTDGLNTASTNARVARFLDSSTTADGSVATGVRVESSRSYTTATGGEHYGLNVYSAPALNISVAKNYGIFIQGAPTGTTAADEQVGLKLHWDSIAAITTPLHIGIGNHIGVVGGVITESRNMEIESAKLFGTITKSVGIRFNGFAGDTNWSILEPIGGAVATAATAKMHHMGPVHVGGSTAETAPLARLQVTETTSGNELLRLTTETTGDDPVEKLFQLRDTTGNATPKNIFTLALSGSKTWLFEAVVVARCTNSSPTESGASYIRRGTIQNIFGSAVFLGPVIDVYSAESVSSWDCTLATDFSINGTTGSMNAYLRVTGATSANITWHGHVRVWEVGA